MKSIALPLALLVVLAAYVANANHSAEAGGLDASHQVWSGETQSTSTSAIDRNSGHERNGIRSSGTGNGLTGGNGDGNTLTGVLTS